MLQRIQDRILVGGLTVFSLWGLYLVKDFPDDAKFFPILVIGLILLVTVLIAISSARSKSAEMADPTPLSAIFVAGALMGAYIGAIFLFGFFIASVLLLFAAPMIWGRGVNKQTLPRMALFAAGLCAFIYAVFVLIFDIPLPSGLIF